MKKFLAIGLLSLPAFGASSEVTFHNESTMTLDKEITTHYDPDKIVRYTMYSNVMNEFAVLSSIPKDSDVFQAQLANTLKLYGATINLCKMQNVDCKSEMNRYMSASSSSMDDKNLLENFKQLKDVDPKLQEVYDKVKVSLLSN